MDQQKTIIEPEQRPKHHIIATILGAVLIPVSFGYLWLFAFNFFDSLLLSIIISAVIAVIIWYGVVFALASSMGLKYPRKIATAFIVGGLIVTVFVSIVINHLLNNFNLL